MNTKAIYPLTAAKAAYIEELAAKMIGKNYTRSMGMGRATVTVSAVRPRSCDEIPVRAQDLETDVMVQYSGSVEGQSIGGCARLHWFLSRWGQL